MALSYTERMENKSYEQYGDYDDFNEDNKELIEYLNDSDFRSFGEGLVFWMQQKNPDINDENIIAYLEKCCQEKDVDITDIASEGTLKNWFYKEMRPKKGEDSRESVFAFAFALGLTPEETSELFHKIYLDRAFDYRNEKEVVYYYCLQNGKSWKDAKRIITQANDSEEIKTDNTIYTSYIKNDIEAIADETALLAYIKEHGNNFAKKNISANKVIRELLKLANNTAKEESSLPEYEDGFVGSDRDSNNFTYEMLTGVSVTGEKGTKTVFKNARLPKEIKSRFPEAGTLSKKNLTYEEIRKLIIILFSYQFWYKAQKAESMDIVDDFVAEINVYLSAAGMSPIYYGNPYDWLFLYCSLAERPLDTFRGIIADVLSDEQ